MNVYLIPICVEEIVEVDRPNGERIMVCALIEGVHAENETLFNLEAAIEGSPHRIVLQGPDGSIGTGRRIYFDDIVAFAIKHGYLEALGDRAKTEEIDEQ
jgi:hypothetical protein